MISWLFIFRIYKSHKKLKLQKGGRGGDGGKWKWSLANTICRAQGAYLNSIQSKSASSLANILENCSMKSKMVSNTLWWKGDILKHHKRSDTCPTFSKFTDNNVQDSECPAHHAPSPSQTITDTSNLHVRYFFHILFLTEFPGMKLLTHTFLKFATVSGM